MNLIKNQKKEIESRLNVYCSTVDDCMGRFQNVMSSYCKDTNRDALGKNVVHIHQAESRADDIRREIETMLYSQSIFPESRGDLLGLLEAIDRVPNSAESAVRMIYNQHIPVPVGLAPMMMELVELSCRAANVLLDSVRKLFSDYTNATVGIGIIDELESKADAIEARLTQEIFSDSLDGHTKILLRDLVEKIGKITDRAESVSDRIRIMVAKRSI